MIVASALIHGFKKEISQKIFDFWGHIQITDAYIGQPFEASPIVVGQEILDSILSIKRIEWEEPIDLFRNRGSGRVKTRVTHGGVKHVQKYIQYPGILSTTEDFEGIFLKGISSDFDSSFFSQYIIEGSPPVRTDNIAFRNLLISQMTASRLNLQVADNVVVNFVNENRQIPRRFSICGIYSTGLAEYDKKIAFLDLRHLQDILDWESDQIGGVEVILEDPEDLGIINNYLYQEILPGNLYTQTVLDRSSPIFDWLELQNINEVIILLLMLIVCVVNMITTLLILILERTYMIGVLKALGANNWLIRKIFIRQAGNILIKGLIVGNGIGLLLCYLQKQFQFIKLREEDYYLAVAPIDVNPWMVLLISAGTLLVTVLFLILPSILISRISPSRAIRFS